MSNMVKANFFLANCTNVANAVRYDNDRIIIDNATALLHEGVSLVEPMYTEVRKGKNGLTLLNANGNSRRMTWRERLAYRLLGKKTSILV